ncbi:hypothetical protein FQN50_005968 [Emmonsiellopsis sp. PD_5]|nr:hypothetical protein FQN50_005968 [Emmonsiellopsis sp. PD_5]
MSLSVGALQSVPRSLALRHAYRHLYRTGLQAVRYAKPQRFVLRGILRSSFRKGAPSEFDPQRIVNTLAFLKLSSASASTEHKIIKNLLHVRFWQQPGARKSGAIFDTVSMSRDRSRMRAHAYGPFEKTLYMLNESLGLCLR